MNGKLNNQESKSGPAAAGNGDYEVVSRDRIIHLQSLERRRSELLSRAGIARRNGNEQSSGRAGFRIAIIGAPKAGKTCILNSLIGSAILPMPVVPAPSGPIWLKWGIEKRVILHSEAGTTRDLALTDLESPAEADCIEVEWPLPLCQGGVEFVEVPAYPSPNGARQEIESADFVLVVLSCRALVSKADLTLIESAAELGLTEVLFVCNQADGVSPEDMKGLEARCAVLLQPRSTVPGQAVFFVSGQWALEGAERQDLALVQRSGIDELRCAITEYVSSNRDRAKAVKMAATERREFEKAQSVIEQATKTVAGELAELQRQSASLSATVETVNRKRGLILSQASQFQETTCAVALQRVQNFILDQASLIQNRSQASPTVVESLMASVSPASFERGRRREAVQVERGLRKTFHGWVETEFLPSFSQSCIGLDNDLGLSIEDFTYVIRELGKQAGVEAIAAPQGPFERFDSKLLLTDLESAQVVLKFSRPSPDGAQGRPSIFYTAIAVAVVSSAAVSIFLHIPLLLSVPLACGGATMYSHSRVTAELSACDRDLARVTAEEIRGQAEQVAQAVAGSVAVEVSRIIHGLRQRIDQMADSATGPAKTAIDSIQGRIREIGERESARRDCRAELNALRTEFDGIASAIRSLAGA